MPLSGGSKVALAVVVAVLLVLSVVVNAADRDQANAAGCIDGGSVPSWYLQPVSGPAVDKCDSLGGFYVPKMGCIFTVSADPAVGTGVCDYGQEPQAVL